jgi:hypothetical protein
LKKIGLTTICLLVLAAAPVAAEGWEQELVLYAWLAGLEGTIGIGDVAQAPVDASFDDLAGFLDFAMAVHFEAKNMKNIFVADVSYVGLRAERDATVANQPATIDMDLDQWIVETGGGYRVKPEFDVLVVGRWYFFDMGKTTTSIAGESTGDAVQNWGDIYLGGRYSRTLKEKWMFSLRGDIGVGGSEFAWFGNALVGYRFNEKLSVGGAWRVLSLDREPDGDNYFLYDVTQSGLGIGVGFAF